MMRKLGLSILMVLLILTLVACASGGEQNPVERPDEEGNNTNNMENQETMDPSPGENTSSQGENEIRISPVEAFDQYMDTFSDTKVEKVKLDREDGIYVYTIQGFDSDKEYELKIHAGDGSILGQESENDRNDDDKEITRDQIEKVQELIATTLSQEEGALLEEWDVEIEDGEAILDMEIKRQGKEDVEYRYHVDAGNLPEKEE